MQKEQIQTLKPGYETTFITRTEMSDDALKALKDKFTSIVQSFGGEVVYFEDWGKRKLAYPMEKETRGHYSFFVYTAKGAVVQEIERNLRIHEHVLRFLTVQLEKEFDAEAYQKANTGTPMKETPREMPKEIH